MFTRKKIGKIRTFGEHHCLNVAAPAVPIRDRKVGSCSPVRDEQTPAGAGQETPGSSCSTATKASATSSEPLKISKLVCACY